MAKDARTRSEAIHELFNITKKELPMKTETPPSKLDSFVMMDVIEHAFSEPKIPRGTKPSELQGVMDKNKFKPRMLSDVYVENHDTRMISKARKGRVELEKILTAQGREEVDELAI